MRGGDWLRREEIRLQRVGEGGGRTVTVGPEGDIGSFWGGGGERLGFRR